MCFGVNKRLKIGHPQDYFIHTNIIVFVFMHLLQQHSQLLLKFLLALVSQTYWQAVINTGT